MSRLIPLLLVLISAPFAVAAAGPEELLTRANAAYRSQRVEEARRLYLQYLELSGDRADVRASLAACYLSLGQVPEALEQTQRALQMDPRLSKAHILLGRIYMSAQQWRLAQRSFDQALTLEPNDRDAVYFSALAFHQEGQLQMAVDRFLKVLSTGPPEGRVYNHLGVTYQMLGRLDDAEGAFRHAMALAPDDPEILLAYGSCLIESGREKEGMPLVQRSFTLRPSAESRFVLARTLYQQAQFDKAAALLEAAESGSDCRVLNLLVKVYRAQGLRQKAELRIRELTTCLATTSTGSDATH